MEFKMMIIGPAAAGKSATLIQFVANHFVDDYDPNIEDSYRKRCCIDEEACLLDIFDSAGSEEFEQMRAAYTRSSNTFVAIYDVTSRKSFEDLQSYIDHVFVARNTSAALFPIVIAANKIDLPNRKITQQEGQKLAKSCHALYHETSAKQRSNVETVFYDCVRQHRLSQTKPDIFKGRYRSSVAFVGDKNSCVGEVLGEITKTRVEVKPSPRSQMMSWSVAGSAVLTVASREISSLTHCISNTRYPNILFLCFSVVNRSSFTFAVEQWQKLKFENHTHQCVVLVGTRSELRDWLVHNKTKSTKSSKSQKSSSASTDYRPFDFLPEEIVVHIFSYLPLLDNVIFTCNRFSRISQHSSLSSIRSGQIQLPITTREEAEQLVAEMKGSLYVECSLSQHTGLKNLSLDGLFEKYLKSVQDEEIKDKMDKLDNSVPVKKKKKKKFFFF